MGGRASDYGQFRISLKSAERANIPCVGEAQAYTFWIARMPRACIVSVLLSFVVFEVSAQEGPANAVLDQLHAAPRPKAQPDLDTVQLAAAHRERAASHDERTNGLWQSWVVAICKGCGVRERQHSDQDVKELVRRSTGNGRIDSPGNPPTAAKPSAPRTVNPMNAIESRGPGLSMVSAKTHSGSR